MELRRIVGTRTEADAVGPLFVDVQFEGPAVPVECRGEVEHTSQLHGLVLDGVQEKHWWRFFVHGKFAGKVSHQILGWTLTEEVAF